MARPPSSEHHFKRERILDLAALHRTCTWLRPGGAMSYAASAEEAIVLLERGVAGQP